MQAWGRLITAMVTPFTANLEVDYEKAVSLANIWNNMERRRSLSAEQRVNLRHCRQKSNSVFSK
jgi:hypothetical protein